MLASPLFACGGGATDPPPPSRDRDAVVDSTPRPLEGGAQMATPQLPDLSIMPTREIYIEGEDAQRVLRFSTTVINSGAGPLELAGEYDTDAGVFVASQRVAQDDGSYAEREAGRFTFEGPHAHWHFEDFTLTELWSAGDDGEPQEMLASAGKGTFCAVDEVPERNGAPPPAYLTCGEGVQGISAGWSDTYAAALPGQELALGDLPDGVYVLRSSVDPDDRLEEADDANNTLVERIEIAGGDVRITSD